MKILACLSTRLQVATPSLWIAAGLFVAGIGQAIFVFAPLASLDSRDAAVVAAWQAVSLGVGLSVASPANNVLFAVLSEAPARWSESASDLSTFLVRYGTASFILVAAVASALIEETLQAQILFWALLTTSLMLQLVAALQRASLAAAQNWRRLALHFSLEGSARVVLTLLAIRSDSGPTGVVSASSVSLLVTLFACEGPRHLARYFGRTPRMSKRNQMRFVSALGAAGSVQIVVSAPPFLSEVAANDWQLTRQFAALSQMQRIGLTVSAPIMVPVLTKVGAALRARELTTVRLQMRRGEAALVGVGLGLLLLTGLSTALARGLSSPVTRIFDDLSAAQIAAASIPFLLLPVLVLRQQRTVLSIPTRRQSVVWPAICATLLCTWLLFPENLTAYFLTLSTSLLLGLILLREPTCVPNEAA